VPLSAPLPCDGGQQPVPGPFGLGPDIEQHEAAGAVGRLDGAGRETALADEGRLLVARDSANGDGAAEKIWQRGTEISRAVPNLGQQGRGRPEQPQQILVPARAVPSVAAHNVSGLCSTQPGCGKICGNSSCAEATGRSAASKMIARVEVVPWSIARMCGAMTSFNDRE
jgi:hypothetical protein